MYYAIAVIIGILLGVFVASWMIAKRKSGTLKVYVPDDPEEPPYLYVELDKSIAHICTKKIALFKVDARNIKTHQ